MPSTFSNDDERALYVAIGTHIRRERRRLGLTQRAVAERTGHNIAWMTHLELGHNRPSIWQLLEVADVLRVSLLTLLPISALGTGDVVTLQRRVAQLESILESTCRDYQRVIQ